MSNQRFQARLSSLTKEQSVKSVNLDDLYHTDRACERQSAYKFGTLRLDTGEEIQCIVQDWSAAGMKVKLPSCQSLTPTMQLTVRGAGFDRVVHLQWQKDDEAGLSF